MEYSNTLNKLETNEVGFFYIQQLDQTWGHSFLTNRYSPPFCPIKIIFQNILRTQNKINKNRHTSNS